MKSLNLEEVKELIVWAKSQGVEQLKYGELAIVFSPMALVQQNPFDGPTELSSGFEDSFSEAEDKLNKSANSVTSPKAQTNEELEDDENFFPEEQQDLPPEEDPDLYWSAQ